MIYFSQLYKKKVKTIDDATIGFLDDLVVSISLVKPRVTKLLIKTNEKKNLIIPIEYLSFINSKIIIKKNYQVTELSINEIFILRNLLDKQIIDLHGNKVVRVNDVCLQEENKNLYLIGVDIGFLGILRRLDLENLVLKIFNFLKIKLKSNFLSWADVLPLELSRGQVRLKERQEKLNRLLPEDLADYLEITSIENVKKFIQLMNDVEAAELINKLNLNYQTDLFKRFKNEEAAKFIKFLAPDEAVDILLTLNKKKREKIIELLPADKKKEISHLLYFSKTSCGELMTTEFIKVKPDNNVLEVMNLIKKESSDFSYLTTIYVVNDQNQLIGVFNLHELLLQDYETPIYQFMHQNLVVVHLSTPKELVLLKMLKYNLQVLPVINEKKQLLGVITIDDLNEFILERLKL